MSEQATQRKRVKKTDDADDEALDEIIAARAKPSDIVDVRSLNAGYVAIVLISVYQDHVRTSSPRYHLESPTRFDADIPRTPAFRLHRDNFDAFSAQFKTLFAEHFCREQKAPAAPEPTDIPGVFNWKPAVQLSTTVFLSNDDDEESTVIAKCRARCDAAIKHAHAETETVANNNSVEVSIVVYKNITRLTNISL